MSQFFISVPGGIPSVATTFATNPDNGTATPIANVITFHGVGGTFSASGGQVTFTVTGTTPAYTQVTSTTDPTTYVVLPTDNFISCDSTLGLLIIELPNSPTLYQQFTVKDRVGSADNNNIEVTTVSGVVLIDGQDSFLLDDAYDSVTVLFNGVGYEIS